MGNNEVKLVYAIGTEKGQSSFTLKDSIIYNSPIHQITCLSSREDMVYTFIP